MKTMPTTISEGFRRLRENLEITELQESTVSTRQKNVRDAVAAELTVLDSFLAGSYKRNTMIRPLKEADVDIFIVLDPKYYDTSGQAALLGRVRRVLLKTYPKTPDISRNGQAVTITFTDFTVDVVPGFYRNGGGYLIPDSILGYWISTDPKRHVDIFGEANRIHNGDLVPLIKMIKAWNRNHSQLLHSFHLEVMILDILTNVKISDSPSGARYVFDKARESVRYKRPDPAGYGGDVSAYLDTTARIDAVVSRLDSAYNRAADGEELANTGRIPQAYDRWRLVFGDYFPSYG
jgi:hypothetical protein